MAVEIDDGFEAFRARYASVRDAVTACEDPIWIARIAFDAAKDKKSIIRAAKWAGRPPVGVDEEGLLDTLGPFHPPLEVIDRWSGEMTEEDEGKDGRMAENIRAALVPFAVCLLLMGLISDGVIWSSLHSHRSLVAVGVGLGVLVIGFWPMKRWYRYIMRVQVARLDEQKAFAIVIKRLARSKRKFPDRVADEIWWLRRKCLEVIDREAAFL